MTVSHKPSNFGPLQPCFLPFLGHTANPKGHQGALSHPHPPKQTITKCCLEPPPPREAFKSCFTDLETEAQRVEGLPEVTQGVTEPGLSPTFPTSLQGSYNRSQDGQGSLATGDTGVPRMSLPQGAPPSAWAGHSAAYQPQDSMTQSCSDLLPSGAPSTPAPPLDPISASSLSGWDQACPGITVGCLESRYACQSLSSQELPCPLWPAGSQQETLTEGGRWPAVPHP